ncbi:AAA family ATPase [Marinisporobacter balticus]|uniref:Putative ATPase n=1 Tax=Marinisporobacter balticus TaxID=2018667 RepID=A0A4R2KNG8_9FIRM|nr:AAA family ATPase [Marinisporobacter balticus]TCO75253.1 putative ATPase [Marinisporobacter balticus]
MDLVRVKLFDTPVVIKNEKKIDFSFKKAEALFYYLLICQQATRDTLANILWGEVEEKTAKKNLRQAMYKIKKDFDMDIIISPKKSVVMLNKDIKIETDIHHFLRDEENSIEVYTGEFLKGFHVKDGEPFDEWMMQYRDKLKDLYMQRLNRKIEDARSEKDVQTVIAYAKKLIEIDNFDEKPYRILMKTYADEGVFHKAIDVYNCLVHVLDHELGIEPDFKTSKIFDEILLTRNTMKVKKKKEVDFFYGRTYELSILEKYYKQFKTNEDSKSLMIRGDAGIGKTKLKEKFLESIHLEECILLEGQCYQAEQYYLFKPWNEIFIKLVEIIKEEKIEIPHLWKTIISNIFPSFARENGDGITHLAEKMDLLKHQVIEEVMIAVLKEVSKRRKILLVFEDIQWMDDISISLLNNMLMHQKKNNIFFIGTLRNGYEGKIHKSIRSDLRHNRLEEIILNPFNKAQVQEFVQMGMLKYSWNERLYDQIYHETKGNTFFLSEILNSIKEKGNMTYMSPKMKDILKNRFLDISKEGKELLNIASLFFDKVSLDMLKLLTSKDVLTVMDIVEELQSRGIIREVSDSEEISFAFTHQKLRAFIYIDQSSVRKKILHNHIGLIFEKKLHYDKRDRFLYSKLIYHFEQGGNELLALKYRMKNLDVYFNFTHELFPVLKDGNIEDEYVSYLSQQEGIKQIKNIEKNMIKILRKESDSEEIKRLRINFLHIRGRYFIREGEYENGVCDIQKMIEIAREIKDADYVIKGYRQMIYYGIQTYNVEWMGKYIELGLDLAKAYNDQKDTGIMLRLKGIEKLMDGKHEEAEEFLKQSIRIFEVVNEYEDKYTLNMAAAYNYIGEIRRQNMKFMRALEYYDRAVNVCVEKNVIGGLTIFYTNGGQTALDMGDDDRAKVYFEKAIQLFDQLNTLWGRSTAEGYMALLLIRKGEYKKALKCLMRAEEYAKKMKSPYEMGLLYRVKAEIKVRMKDNGCIHEVFKNYLTLNIKNYCDKGIEFLKQVKDPYEIEILGVLKKNA